LFGLVSNEHRAQNYEPKTFYALCLSHNHIVFYTV